MSKLNDWIEKKFPDGNKFINIISTVFSGAHVAQS